MKTMEKVLAGALAICLLIISSGCESTPKHSGFLGDYYRNLEPGPKDGAGERWFKPGVDFSKYNRFMIDHVVFYYAPDSEDKSIRAEDIKQLTDAFTLEIVKALKDKYPIVTEPGKDVARLRIALTDVKKNPPPISDLSTVMPRERRLNEMRNVSLNTWSGTGKTTAELMVVDSSTNEVIAAAVVERAAGFAGNGAMEAFRYWAGRIRGYIDRSREPKP